MTVASLGVWGVTGKSTGDHVFSHATDSDCVGTRVIVNERVCQDSIYRQERAFDQRKR